MYVTLTSTHLCTTSSIGIIVYCLLMYIPGVEFEAEQFYSSSKLEKRREHKALCTFVGVYTKKHIPGTLYSLFGVDRRIVVVPRQANIPH